MSLELSDIFDSSLNALRKIKYLKVQYIYFLTILIYIQYIFLS